MGRLKVGIAGRRGSAFVAGLRAHPDAELTALCEIDPAALERQGREFEVDLLFADYEQMLDSVDAVVVATPMHLHATQAILALRAGKHVLSEVTAAVTLDECWRLLDAVRESTATYMLSENYCYMADNILVRELVREGLFGEIYFGEGEYLHEVRDMHHFPDGRPTWRSFWQVGVNGSTYPTHSLGPVMQWFTALDPQERVDRVICVGSGIHTEPEHPHDDTTLLLCTLASGKLVKVRLDMMSNRPHLPAFYSVQGTRGVYEGARQSGQRGIVWVGESEAGGKRQWRPISDFDDRMPRERREMTEAARKAGHGGGDYFVVKDFVDAALGRTPPAIDIYTALEWTAAGLCSQVSLANRGAAISVPNFRDRSKRPLTLDLPPPAWP